MIMTNNDQIFTQYEASKLVSAADKQAKSPAGHVMFDPLNTFKGLNDESMDSHLSQEQFKNITPWRALTEVIAIPVVMLAFIVAVKINIFIKIILIFMIVVHVIISTCLVSYLSKSYNAKTTGTLGNIHPATPSAKLGYDVQE